MAIREVFDEINDVTVFFAEGEVAQISFKAIEPADKFGNTHRAGVRIGDDWVNNINIKVKEGNDPSIRFNAGTQGSPKWETLAVGDKVKVVVQPSEYNGKTYYNSGVSKIKLVKKGEGVAVKETASGGAVKEAYKPKDMSGVSVGHSLNGAILLGMTDDPTILSASKEIHLITEKLKAEYAEKNPSMSAYDVGASVGNSVLNACRLAEDVQDVEAFARDLLENVVPEIMKFVKLQGKEEVQEEKKPVAAKRGRKPAEKKVEKEPTDDDSFSPPFDPDLDDSIPF